MGGQTWSGAFAVVIIVYFFVGGFLIGYLATRLYLGQALTAAERTYSLEKQLSKLQQQTGADALALQLATAQLTGAEADEPSQPDLDAAVTGASGEMRAQIFYRAQLQRLRNWRDDATKPKMERTIAVFRALIASDLKDNYHANHGELGFALKDQRTPDWSAAESELSRAITIRGESADPLHRPYEANRALCLVMLDEFYRDTKPSSDEAKLRIVEDLKRAIQDDATKTWVKTTLTLKKWLALNKLDLNSLP